MMPQSFYRNYRPSWLDGLELDFFFPELNAAIEFQGDHHYSLTGYTDKTAFFTVQTNDRHKDFYCRRNGVILIKIDAIDLRRRKMKYWFKRISRHAPICESRLKNGWFSRKAELIKLDKECVQYRASLKSSFGSPTVHKRRTKARRKAIESKWQGRDNNVERFGH